MIYNIKNGIYYDNFYHEKFIGDIYEYIKTYKPNRIYLDVDGVLWHSCQAICDMYYNDLGNRGTLVKENERVSGSDILSWNFKELNPSFDDGIIEFMFSREDFFDYVSWIEGARQFMMVYKDLITIVTKGVPDNLKHKIKYFEEYFVPIYGLPLTCSKSIVNMQGGLFIDDVAKNLEESNATYKIQFLEYNDNKNYKREWIKDWNGLKMYGWAKKDFQYNLENSVCY